MMPPISASAGSSDAFDARHQAALDRENAAFAGLWFWSAERREPTAPVRRFPLSLKGVSAQFCTN
jgi:hypothetical protein